MKMYLGRILIVGITKNNEFMLGYRISSRSFPDRKITQHGSVFGVEPSNKIDVFNPYIYYNCLLYNDDFVVVGNGAQTDIVFNKLNNGVNIRDAIGIVLLGMDYEFDSHNTPRIVSVLNCKNGELYLGIIKKDGIEIKKCNLEKGSFQYISTYECNSISTDCIGEDFDIASAKEGCDFILKQNIFENFSHPVASACLIKKKNSFDVFAKSI